MKMDLYLEKLPHDNSSILQTNFTEIILDNNFSKFYIPKNNFFRFVKVFTHL